MSENLIIQSNGLSNSKLQLATATEEDVLKGKTFYSGNKILKNGNRSKGQIVAAYIWNNQVEREDKLYFSYSSESNGTITAKKSFNATIYPLLFSDKAMGTLGIKINGSLILSATNDGSQYVFYTTPKNIYINQGDVIQIYSDSWGDWGAVNYIIEINE